MSTSITGLQLTARQGCLEQCQDLHFLRTAGYRKSRLEAG